KALDDHVNLYTRRCNDGYTFLAIKAVEEQILQNVPHIIWGNFLYFLKEFLVVVLGQAPNGLVDKTRLRSIPEGRFLVGELNCNRRTSSFKCIFVNWCCAGCKIRDYLLSS